MSVQAPPTSAQRRVLSTLEKTRDRIAALESQLQEQLDARPVDLALARRVVPPVPVADIADAAGLTEAGYRFAIRTRGQAPSSVPVPSRARVLSDLRKRRDRIASIRAQMQTQYAKRAKALHAAAALDPPPLVRESCAAAGISPEMYHKIIRANGEG